MKLILKGLLGLTFVYYLLIASLILAYAEIPDVSKWSCPNAVIRDIPDYSTKVINCSSDGAGNAYAKVSGELIYIHEHRMDADKAVYYNALKTNEGNWVEVVNDRDLTWKYKKIGEVGKEDIEVSISDDNGVVVAKRIIPLLKK